MSAGPAGVLIGPDAYHPGWTATVGGDLAGPVRPRDGLMSWELGAGDEPVAVTLSFRPQRTYEIALAISAGTVVCCIVLLFGRRRSRGVV